MTVKLSWTHEQAWTMQEAHIAANPEKSLAAEGPYFQWIALQRLEVHRENFQNGDEFSLMHAIKECAQHNLIMPDWAARAYLKGFYSVVNYRNKSWDGVFGAPYQKGTNITARRKKRRLQFAVLNEINNILRSDEPKPPIGPALFERVGKKFNIGKTLTEEYYYSAKKHWEKTANF